MPITYPYDLESEQALLGAILVNNKIFKAIDLSYDDFYEKKNQHIYACMAELMEDGLEIDNVTLWAKVKSKKIDKEITPIFLAELSDQTGYAGSAQWESYVSIIKKKSAARKLINLSYKIQKAAQNGLNDLTGKIEASMKELIEIKEKAENKPRSLTEEIREWILITSDNFLITDVYKDLRLITRDNRMKAATILNRLEKDNIIVKCGTKRGCYRVLEKDAPLIDWLNVRLGDPYKIMWPFGIEEIVDLYPGNVVVIAGSANAGKTAFLLNVIKNNMQTHQIEYFSSEMAPEELHLRLNKFPDIGLHDWRFAARRRSNKFADVIVPDALNIIDYLEITKDFYEVGGDIKDIFDRLNKGIAIIAIQKKTGAETGRGGEFTLEKPRLYLTIESGILKIVKGKNWSNPEINPNGMTWTFKLVNGCRFIETGGTVWNAR